MNLLTVELLGTRRSSENIAFFLPKMSSPPISALTENPEQRETKIPIPREFRQGVQNTMYKRYLSVETANAHASSGIWPRCKRTEGASLAR